MVHAASAPLTSLAGMALSEVFPSPHTALLFAQLKHSETWPVLVPKWAWAHRDSQAKT